MIEGVRNLVDHVNLSLEEAVRMATLYPAKAIGVDDRYGKLEKDYIADIAILESSGSSLPKLVELYKSKTKDN